MFPVDYYLFYRQKWVECIARGKVFPEDVFHTEKHHQAGFTFQLRIWLIRWLSWQREDLPHLKLVFSWEISMEFLKLKVLLDLRFWEFWRLMEWPHHCPKTSTTLLRRLSTSESISKSKELTRMASSDLFWLSPESTDLPGTTEKLLHCLQPGDTNQRRPTPFFPERSLSWWLDVVAWIN